MVISTVRNLLLLLLKSLKQMICLNRLKRTCELGEECADAHGEEEMIRYKNISFTVVKATRQAIHEVRVRL